ncbi:hypothetical protein ABPG74_011962 [Tetrahymena malaccensis]
MINQQKELKFSNSIESRYQFTQHFSSQNCEKPSKQCFYRYSSSSNQVEVVCTQSELKCKQCCFRQINNNISFNQSSQFSQYVKQFYSHEFLKNIYHKKCALVYPQHHCSTINNIAYSSLKKEEDGASQLYSYQTMMSNDDCFTSQDILYTMTEYLESIKPRFQNYFSSYSDETIILNVKEGCQNSLHECINYIFEKSYTAAVIKVKSKYKSLNLLQICKKKRVKNSNHEQGDKFIAQTQSEYHNFKNSFMNIITQLICPQVLNCFDLNQYQKSSLTELITTVKENSVKFRPVKGKYQYYSNMHYTTLFLKCYESSFSEFKRNSKFLNFHSKIFKLDVLEFQNANFFEIIKINYLKSMIGQVVVYCLDIAENQIQQIKNNQGKISYNRFLKSRFIYISKVKKGIQKLLKGQKVKRF